VLPEQFAFVRVINLGRNFGQHVALSCGYRHVRGTFVGMPCIDIQEHPKQIPKLLSHIEATDCDIVFGIRDHRAGPRTDQLELK